MGSNTSTPSPEATTPPARPSAATPSGGAGSQTSERVTISVNIGTTAQSFSPGDLVKVIDDLTKMKILQRGHGEYIDAMRGSLGQIGAVLHVFPSRDVRVIVNSKVWTFNPLCLTPVRRNTSSDISARLRALGGASDVSDEITAHFMRLLSTSLEDSLGLRTSKTPSRYSVGQKVKICSDITRVKLLQAGHGGYNDNMRAALGRVGTVSAIDSDGDLRVKFRNGHTWCFNPDLAEAVSDEESESSDSDSDSMVSTTLQRMMREILGVESTDDSGGGSVRVKSHLTPLLIACYNGSESVVRMMITTGADVNEKSKDGDSALHFGVYGDKPEILELLVNFGAHINAKNKKDYTALHAAVNEDFTACVRVLTNYVGVLDVNTQDEYGDTPLHDAIRKENNQIVDLLMNFPTIDIMVKNKRGFNAFHHAALKGNLHAVERILSKRPELVDSKKGDGYAALHLAAVNNHCNLAKFLLTKGRCNVDLKDNEQRTALLLAVHEGNCDMAEILVEGGANINQPDGDGDTPMHVSLLRRSKFKVGSIDSSKAPVIKRIASELTRSAGVDSNLALACFLANRGGDLHKKNKAGLTPLEMAGDIKTVELLLIWKTQISTQSASSPERPHGGPAATTASADGKCKVCLDSPASVWFEPCGHRLYCSECCRRMKCCLECGERITGKVSDVRVQRRLKMTLRWILDLGANGDKKKYQHRVQLLRIGVFMLMTMGFLYQASKVVEEYLSHPSAVDVRIEGTEVLLFPGLSVCVTNWVSKTKLCEHYPDFCETNTTDVEEVRKLLLTGGKLGDIAHSSEDVLQIGFVNPTQYFFEFYLSPNVTQQSYSRLPHQMCYTMNWRHDNKIKTVHQNVLAFEMNVLFAWPEDDVIEMDEFEMSLGFHHVDTNTAGKKHAMAFKPSGDFIFGIVQEGVVSLPAPFDTKCDNYSRYLRLPNYKVKYSKEICYEECRKDITREVCGCIPNDYAWRNHIKDRVCDLHETTHCVHTDGRAMYSVVCNDRCHTACRETIYKATQSAWKQAASMSMEGLTYVKVRALMTSRSVYALHFIPLLTGTQVLGLVGGYSGFWMGVAIAVGATESVRVVFDFFRRRVRGRLHKAEIAFLFRVCKMLIMLGCFVACAFSIYWDYDNYRHFYTAVTYEQQNMRGVFFPAVTICSYEAVNFTRMCTEYGRYNKCVAATFDTTVGNDITAMKYVINYTYPPADVFSNCTMSFSGEICESFKCDNLWDPTYTFVKTGVCFILNIGRSPELQRCQEQYKYRLNFRVRADTKDPRNENMAFSALVHATSSYTSGIIHTFRFQAGRKYTISVAQNELVSLPLPYETRCIDYVATADESLYDEKEIQEEECSEFCVAQKWTATCGCFSKMYAVKHRMKGSVCEYVPHMRCIEELIKQKWFVSCQNVCTRGCKDTRYRGLMFQTGFITDYARYENLEADLTVVLGSTKRKIVSNLPRMTMADFLLYLSGHVSMWLGVSLIAASPLVADGVKYVQQMFSAFATSMGFVMD